MKKITAIAAILMLTSCLTPTGTQKPVEVVNYGAQAGAGSTGIHTVLEGDTVYTVSKQYNLPLREIISFNHLSAPYALSFGYRLKLPPPNEYKVKAGDTLNGLSRLFNVSMNEMAKMNNLSEPFIINKGQVLRLPSSQPDLEKDFAVNASPPSFQSDLEAGEQTSVPVKIAGVEAEALPPPPGAEPAKPVTPVSVVNAGAAFPPQPAPAQAQSSQAPPSPVVQKTAAVQPSIAPKVPARSGTGRFMRPVDGNIISNFGPKDGGLHNDGINIKAAKGTAVRAAENGVVAYTGNEMSGYGNLVLIRHADRWMTAYAHMDKTLVKKGDVVKVGQSIGTVGATGSVDTPQLHFEVRKGTQAVDPKKYL